MVETVENVLETTKPTSVFASAVLSGVLWSGKSMVGSSGVVAASATASQASTVTFWLPLANLPVTAWLLRAALKEARSDKERDMIVKQLGLCTVGLIPLAGMMFGSILLPEWPRNPLLKGLVIPGIMVLYMVPVLWSSRILARRVEKLREGEHTASLTKDSPLITGTKASPLLYYVGSASIIAAGSVLWLALSQRWALVLLACVTACGLAALGYALRGSESVRTMRVYGFTLASVALCMIVIPWLNVASSLLWFAACIQVSALSFAVLQVIAWRRVHGK